MSSSAIIELASGPITVWREGSSIYTDRQVTQEELDEIHRLMRTADELASPDQPMSDWDTTKEFFIQWKGTDACIDLHCPACSYHNHYDGFFAYYVQCAKCKALYKLRELIPFEKIETLPHGHRALQCEYEPEDDDSPDQPAGDA